eukprot:ANDGO_01351.mRNA.1 hypothetical protein
MADIYVWLGAVEYFVIKDFAELFYFTLVQRNDSEDEVVKERFTQKLASGIRKTDEVLIVLRQFRSDIKEDLECMTQSIQTVCQRRLLMFQDRSEEELLLEWQQMEEVWKVRSQLNTFIRRDRDLKPLSEIHAKDVSSQQDVVLYLLHAGRCGHLSLYFCQPIS